MVTIEALEARSETIGVVGLGYVGVSLLVALGCHFRVCGFDRDLRRVRELTAGIDRTRSVTSVEVQGANACCTADETALRQCKLIIIAVPTPITATSVPDLGPLTDAAGVVGRQISVGTVVVVESTVYPGVTEDIIRPILVEENTLRKGEPFYIGYSPERINPGDDQHSLDRIPKVVAGESSVVTDLMARVYGTISSGVHRASSIRVAEAAKVLENTQRDVNIALMNEAAMIFRRLGVDTQEVIRTARTKWNFVPFEPGLVGGDCIPTDPHYLVHAAKMKGSSATVISASREVNDGMGRYVARHTTALIRDRRRVLPGAQALILGISFKEDVPRVQNSRVPDIVDYLERQHVKCSVFDPIADPDEVRSEFGYRLLDKVERHAPYDAVVVAVKHRSFKTMFTMTTLRELMAEGAGIVVDVKSLYVREEVEAAGLTYWRL